VPWTTYKLKYIYIEAIYMLFQKQQKEEEKKRFYNEKKNNEMLTLDLGVFASLCIKSHLLGV
jgi:hypothetical protein